MSSGLGHAALLLRESERSLRRADLPSWADNARRLLVADVADCGRRLANMRTVIGDRDDGRELEHLSAPLQRVLEGRDR